MNILIAIFCLSFLTHAELDSSSKEALDQTKALLNNSEARQKAAKQSPEAQKAYNHAKKLMHNQQGTDALFGLSSEVFEHLVKQTKGDSEKLNELLQKAANDPEAFARSLPPELQQKIKKVSTQVPKSNYKN